MEPEGSEELATGLCSEPYESSPHPQIVFQYDQLKHSVEGRNNSKFLHSEKITKVTFPALAFPISSHSW